MRLVISSNRSQQLRSRRASRGRRRKIRFADIAPCGASGRPRRHCNQVFDIAARSANGFRNGREVGGRRAPRQHQALGLDQPQRADDFVRLEPHVERRVDDADFEAGIFEKDVLDRQRQQRRQIVAGPITQFDEPQGQRGGSLVELPVRRPRGRYRIR